MSLNQRRCLLPYLTTAVIIATAAAELPTSEMRLAAREIAGTVNHNKLLIPPLTAASADRLSVAIWTDADRTKQLAEPNKTRNKRSKKLCAS